MTDIYSPPEADLSADMVSPVYAGFWLRVVASLLDTIWMLLLTFSLAWMVYGPSYFASEQIIQGYGDFIISYILPFVLTIIFWTFNSGCSLRSSPTNLSVPRPAVPLPIAISSIE